ncbi:ATP-binding cassette domain-containing protein, partial [Streptomyces rhizosphaericus]|uniref:ATP-binding cassette domain-containing protein n=1 Tax=Streptomyces rhizosphaericus TaxID=114699 RepID=UPI003B8A7CF0
MRSHFPSNGNRQHAVILLTLTGRARPTHAHKGRRMIEAVGLTKRYGAKTAVYNLSFQVRPGAVTGFLGPNGSGKSTTM